MPNSGAGFGPAVIAWFEQKVDRIPEEVYPVVIDAGENIALQTREYIETRGTAKSGKQGRIETTAMLESVDNEVVKATDDELEVRAGYHDAPFYTVFQELGTSRIEAMYALTDAAEEILARLPKEIEGAMKRV
jgi:hypothetical protein